jgi:hypothetical protein
MKKGDLQSLPEASIQMRSTFTYLSVAILALLVTLNGCTSTKLVSSWRNPETTVEMKKLNKVLVIALLKDENMRRNAEEQLVKHHPEFLAPSYNIISSEMLKNQELVSETVASGGYDGMIIMRLVDREESTTYVPGNYPTYYGGWYQYYRYSAPYYYNPGYYQTSKYYSVETNIYSVNPDKLVWSGITSTLDPDNVKNAIDEIDDVIYAKMKKEGFLLK